MRAPFDSAPAQSPQMSQSIKHAIDLAAPAVEAIASSPKVAAAVAAGTASLGAAAKLDVIQGALSLASMSIGIVTGVVVLAIQTIKLVRVWKAWHADKPEPKDPE